MKDYPNYMGTLITPTCGFKLYIRKDQYHYSYCNLFK